MKVWKHHIAINFETGKTPVDAHAGTGGTVFLDYGYMISYLRETNERWYVAELEVEDTDLNFCFDDFRLANLKKVVKTISKFVPLEL